MLLFSFALCLFQHLSLGAAISLPLSQSFFHAGSTNNTISWEKCGEISGRVFECGRLSVPLDYGNPLVGEASLSILRLLADKDTRRGSLFTNPGGPGVSGTGDYQRERSLDMMEESGGEYDIVSWDIRGVNDTTPQVSCFDSQESADDFWAGSLWYKGVETNSSLRSSFDQHQFYSHVDAEDTRLRALWKRCEERSGNFLPFVGTAANARDVARMSDAIDGSGSEINYWGFSYGSVLGQYIIALFPERLGRVIIDGVVYAPIWGAEPAVDMYNQLLTDTDSAYHGFAALCAQAGPDRCALASNNSTADSILEDIRVLIQTLYDPYGDLDESLARSSSIRLNIFMRLQVPRGTWPALARFLKSQQDLVNAHDGEEITLASLAVSEAYDALHNKETLERHTRVWPYDFYSNYWSIICSDGPDYDGTSTRDMFDTIVEACKLSDTFGPMWPTEGGWPCHHWKTRAVERVTHFSVKPKHPVLILSNEYDSVTSIANAYKILENTFAKGDAGLGIREGYGHCSYSTKSSCLTHVIQNYVRNWTLPEDTMKPCPVNEDLFPQAD
ncbi:hypothetical protein FIBSPDRAFT_796394 [Athelia psychrophila]|uniref:Peptidase S33 tripeptidyl aminopeptidase-like C-terminal domain-containing protein n=1 Tax=Athelia psychrophila TaxID=1759441 RepID=A0A166DKM7_9AGAM|nr:hypothetical protein FIBSPDRAFT_796394 [Fibularhizoctonia sp. CBS 109695]